MDSRVVCRVIQCSLARLIFSDSGSYERCFVPPSELLLLIWTDTGVIYTKLAQSAFALQHPLSYVAFFFDLSAYKYQVYNILSYYDISSRHSRSLSTVNRPFDLISYADIVVCIHLER